MDISATPGRGHHDDGLSGNGTHVAVAAAVASASAHARCKRFVGSRPRSSRRRATLPRAWPPVSVWARPRACSRGDFGVRAVDQQVRRTDGMQICATVPQPWHEPWQNDGLHVVSIVWVSCSSSCCTVATARK